MVPKMATPVEEPRKWPLFKGGRCSKVVHQNLIFILEAGDQAGRCRLFLGGDL